MFFLKQKTAYEMRISDWSSDVCSSDLDDRENRRPAADPYAPIPNLPGVAAILDTYRTWRRRGDRRRHPTRRRGAGAIGWNRPARRPRREPTRAPRSEEHTSELQSLMRLSYAVICLKKKKHKNDPSHQL